MRLLTLFTFAAVALGAPSDPMYARDFALKPTEDPFYTPDANFANKTVGTILRSRPAPGPFRSLFLPAKIAKATQYLVRSTGQSGEPSYLVTTLLEPFNADPLKLVSYHPFTDSSNPNCAPSYSILANTSPDYTLQTVITQAEILLAQVHLNRGYFVVVPDFQGPTAAFAFGRQAAYAVLDSIRAVLGTENGVSPNAKVVMQGYSGGSLPSIWAAAMQPKYAPDLKGKLVGSIMGGTVTSLESVAHKIDGTLFAGFLVQSLAGFRKIYPKSAHVFEEAIPKHLPFLKEAYNYCMLPSLVIWTLQRVFTPPFQWAEASWALFDHPVIRPLIDENTLANDLNPSVPEIPVYMYHGQLDEIIPFDQNSERIYNTWCSQNPYSIEFAVDKTGAHVTTALTTIPAIYDWIDDRLNGIEPEVRGCKRRDHLSNIFIPSSQKGVYELIITSISGWLGFPVGPMIALNPLGFVDTLRKALEDKAGIPDPTTVPGYIAPGSPF